MSGQRPKFHKKTGDGSAHPSRTGLREDSRMLLHRDEEDPGVLELLEAAQSGRHEEMVRVLDRGVDVNSPLVAKGPDEGQTAVIRAAKFGQIRSVEILLGRGADAFHEDAQSRSAFYFACFGVHCERNSQALMQTLLNCHVNQPFCPGFQARQRASHSRSRGITPDTLQSQRRGQLVVNEQKLQWSKVALLSAYSNRDGVTQSFLDHLGHFVKSRDSKDVADMEFFCLELLDNPHVHHKWPDGSSTSRGETALRVLSRKNRIDMLSHPSVLALLEWKWKSFVRATLLFEILLVFLLWVSTVLLGYGLLMFEKDWFLLLYLEIFLVTCSVGLGLWDGLDSFLHMARTARTSGGGWFRFPTAAMGVRFGSTAVVPVLCGTYLLERWGNNRNNMVYSLVVGIIAGWVRLATYFTKNRKIGPFLIMVKKMVVTDVLWYLLILFFLIPPFLVGFNLLNALHSNSNHPVQDGLVSMLLAGLGFSDAVDVLNLSSDPVTSSLFLLYILLVPLLAVNLLIAMMNHTFSLIADMSDKVWALEFSRFVCEAEVKHGWICQAHAAGSLWARLLFGLFGCVELLPNAHYVGSRREYDKHFTITAKHGEFFLPRKTADEDGKNEELLEEVRRAEQRIGALEAQTSELLSLVQQIHANAILHRLDGSAPG